MVLLPVSVCIIAPLLAAALPGRAAPAPEDSWDDLALLQLEGDTDELDDGVVPPDVEALRLRVRASAVDKDEQLARRQREAARLREARLRERSGRRSSKSTVTHNEAAAAHKAASSAHEDGGAKHEERRKEGKSAPKKASAALKKSSTAHKQATAAQKEGPDMKELKAARKAMDAAFKEANATLTDEFERGKMMDAAFKEAIRKETKIRHKATTATDKGASAATEVRAASKEKAARKETLKAYKHTSIPSLEAIKAASAGPKEESTANSEGGSGPAKSVAADKDARIAEESTVHKEESVTTNATMSAKTKDQMFKAWAAIKQLVIQAADTSREELKLARVAAKNGTRGANAKFRDHIAAAINAFRELAKVEFLEEPEYANWTKTHIDVAVRALADNIHTADVVEGSCSLIAKHIDSTRISDNRMLTREEQQRLYRLGALHLAIAGVIRHGPVSLEVAEACSSAVAQLGRRGNRWRLETVHILGTEDRAEAVTVLLQALRYRPNDGVYQGHIMKDLLDFIGEDDDMAQTIGSIQEGLADFLHAAKRFTNTEDTSISALRLYEKILEGTDDISVVPEPEVKSLVQALRTAGSPEARGALYRILSKIVVMDREDGKRMKPLLGSGLLPELRDAMRRDSEAPEASEAHCSLLRRLAKHPSDIADAVSAYFFNDVIDGVKFQNSLQRKHGSVRAECLTALAALAAPRSSSHEATLRRMSRSHIETDVRDAVELWRSDGEVRRVGDALLRNLAAAR